MRVTFDMLTNTVAAANAAAQQMFTAEQQLETGKALQVPSDNPAAMEDAVNQHAELGTIDSFLSSGNAVAARQSAADSVLSDIVNKITAAITQATAASGSTVDQDARDAASQAITGIRDALVGDVNTTVGGVSLFAGSKTDQTAYVNTGSGWVYQGDNNGVDLAIDTNRSAAETWSGQAIFQGSASQNLLDVLDTLSTAVTSGDQTTINNSVTELQSAFQRATTVQSQLGSDENSVQDAQSRLTSLRLATDTRRSQDEDANMADAATRLSQAQTAYQASLAAAARVGQISLLDYLGT